MDFFLINTLPLADKSFCVLELSPEGTDDFKFKMSYGKPAAAEYPSDAKWHMSPAYPARLTVPSIVDNTSRLLVVKRDVMEVLAAAGVPIECLPFTLYDHKGRVASAEHFIVNPLGDFDCLDLAKCDVAYSEEHPGEILEIERYALDPKKVEKAPDLFRIHENPETYVVSHRLVERLRPLAPTNLYLKKLDQAA